MLISNVCVLDTTLNQGLINHDNNGGSSVNGLTSASSKTMKGPAELFLTSGYSDEIAFQHYLQRILATTLNQGLHMQKDTGRGSQPTAALHPLRSQGKQDSGIPLAPQGKTFHPRATDHVFQPDPEISPRSRAACDKHGLHFVSRSSREPLRLLGIMVSPGMRPHMSSA